MIITDSQAQAGQIAPVVTDNKRLWLHKTWIEEYTLANAIFKRIHIPIQPLSTELSTYFKKNSAETIHARPEQIQAIKHAATHAFTLITGGPGTGKTYTIAQLVAALIQTTPHIHIALAAPTGKAAKRMDESLHHALKKSLKESQLAEAQIEEAQTLHRLLGLGFNQISKYHQQNPLPYDLIIIDEASMLSLTLARQLFEAVSSKSKLILLGDADQLAAVEPGAVLHDISQHPIMQSAICSLKQSQRFANHSGIGQLAEKILAPESNNIDTLEQLFKQHDDISYQIPDRDFYTKLAQPYQNYFDALKSQTISEKPDKLFSYFDDYRILCASKHKAFGTKAINNQLKHIHCRILGYSVDSPYFHGLPLMLCENDYTNNLFNGDIGICLMIEKELGIYFPDRTNPIPLTRLNLQALEIAYALTIHKSQGSEYQHIALTFDPSQNQGLTRELLYTGITRAKHKLTLYTSPQLLAEIAQTPTQRTTGLATFIDKLGD